ncbi:glycerophosphodiester phosphodiesterase family protein [Sphingobacterium wenxiniae]|uniref:Glycerophosphoryl diester phosphodiesterase n=1 Tax=Sphingobacterium wenxiniae TaxID=683125 RepID=A0A1I6V521_9SPHI|nr:glycerophosphodiester phosphodiesterase family protein [Sphingobacterium wenxiniae]SFT08780.1 glycerophosphoryl diester phosphodiesterase [Sphingobacterium wenxiniae]
MKRKRVYWLYCLLLLFISCAVPKQHNFALLNKTQQGKVWVVAHRANTGENIYPENSIETMRSCIAYGMDIMEIDVRETVDGHLVILHDSTVDRTTNGHGKVKDMTLNKLRELRLVHQGDTTPYVVPTLEEVFKLIKGNILVDLDIKFENPQSYKKIVDLAQQYGVQDQLLIFLYDKNDISRIHSIANGIQLLPRARSVEDLDFMKQYDFIHIIHIDDSYYEDSLMQGLINSGTRVWLNTLGKYDQAERENKTGFEDFFTKTPHVNVVQTDLSLQLIAYLKDRGWRN